MKFRSAFFVTAGYNFAWDQILTPPEISRSMQSVKIIIWQENDAWLGYLQEYPDYQTQGETEADLKEHLRDLHQDLTSGAIPGIRKVEDLEVA